MIQFILWTYSIILDLQRMEGTKPEQRRQCDMACNGHLYSDVNIPQSEFFLHENA